MANPGTPSGPPSACRACWPGPRPDILDHLGQIWLDPRARLVRATLPNGGRGGRAVPSLPTSFPLPSSPARLAFESPCCTEDGCWAQLRRRALGLRASAPPFADSVRRKMKYFVSGYRAEVSQSGSFCTDPGSLTRCQRRRRLPDCAARPPSFPSAMQKCEWTDHQTHVDGGTDVRAEGRWEKRRNPGQVAPNRSSTSSSLTTSSVGHSVLPSVVSQRYADLGQASTVRLRQARLSVVSSHTYTRTAKEIETNRICLSLSFSLTFSLSLFLPYILSHVRRFRQPARSVFGKFVIVTFLASLFSRQFQIRCHSFT